MRLRDFSLCMSHQQFSPCQSWNVLMIKCISMHLHEKKDCGPETKLAPLIWPVNGSQPAVWEPPHYTTICLYEENQLTCCNPTSKFMRLKAFWEMHFIPWPTGVGECTPGVFNWIHHTGLLSLWSPLRSLSSSLISIKRHAGNNMEGIWRVWRWVGEMLRQEVAG